MRKQRKGNRYIVGMSFTVGSVCGGDDDANLDKVLFDDLMISDEEDPGRIKRAANEIKNIPGWFKRWKKILKTSLRKSDIYLNTFKIDFEYGTLIMIVTSEKTLEEVTEFMKTNYKGVPEYSGDSRPGWMGIPGEDLGVHYCTTVITPSLALIFWFSNMLDMTNRQSKKPYKQCIYSLPYTKDKKAKSYHLSGDLLVDNILDAIDNQSKKDELISFLTSFFKELHMVPYNIWVNFLTGKISVMLYGDGTTTTIELPSADSYFEHIGKQLLIYTNFPFNMRFGDIQQK